MALTGTLVARITVDQTFAGDLGSSRDSEEVTGSWSIADGTGANQADKKWSDTRVLTTAATEDLDLAAALTNARGETVTFVKLKAIIITCPAANTTSVTVSRPAANGLALFGSASDALAALKPGGGFAFWDPSAAGVPVAAGTGDLLTLTNGAGASATYSIMLVGTSA